MPAKQAIPPLGSHCQRAIGAKVAIAGIGVGMREVGDDWSVGESEVVTGAVLVEDTITVVGVEGTMVVFVTTAGSASSVQLITIKPMTTKPKINLKFTISSPFENIKLDSYYLPICPVAI